MIAVLATSKREMLRVPLSAETISQLAESLDVAEASKTQIGQFSAAYPTSRLSTPTPFNETGCRES
jgi:hypothetical protein